MTRCNYCSLGAETFALSLNQYEYNIDFKNLVQTNTTTGKARKLRRRPTKFIGEEDMGGLSSKYVNLLIYLFMKNISTGTSNSIEADLN